MITSGTRIKNLMGRTPIFYASREQLSDCLPEIKPILQEHWEELAQNRDIIPLDPRWDAYDNMESSGVYRMYVVRTHDTDEIAGYVGIILHKHLHYAQDIWALTDLFFVRKKFRRKFKWPWQVRPNGAGTTLFDAVEADLKEIGASVIHCTWKLSNPAAWKLFRRRGYKKIEAGAALVLKRFAK